MASQNISVLPPSPDEVGAALYEGGNAGVAPAWADCELTSHTGDGLFLEDILDDAGAVAVPWDSSFPENFQLEDPDLDLGMELHPFTETEASIDAAAPRQSYYLESFQLQGLNLGVTLDPSIEFGKASGNQELPLPAPERVPAQDERLQLGILNPDFSIDSEALYEGVESLLATPPRMTVQENHSQSTSDISDPSAGVPPTFSGKHPRMDQNIERRIEKSMSIQQNKPSAEIEFQHYVAADYHSNQHRKRRREAELSARGNELESVFIMESPDKPTRARPEHTFPMRKRTKMDIQNREDVKKLSPCVRCRRYNLKCDNGLPCGSCNKLSKSTSAWSMVCCRVNILSQCEIKRVDPPKVLSGIFKWIEDGFGGRADLRRIPTENLYIFPYSPPYGPLRIWITRDSNVAQYRVLLIEGCGDEARVSGSGVVEGDNQIPSKADLEVNELFLTTCHDFGPEKFYSILERATASFDNFIKRRIKSQKNVLKLYSVFRALQCFVGGCLSLLSWAGGTCYNESNRATRAVRVEEVIEKSLIVYEGIRYFSTLLQDSLQQIKIGSNGFEEKQARLSFYDPSGVIAMTFKLPLAGSRSKRELGDTKPEPATSSTLGTLVFSKPIRRTTSQPDTLKCVAGLALRRFFPLRWGSVQPANDYRTNKLEVFSIPTGIKKPRLARSGIREKTYDQNINDLHPPAFTLRPLLRLDDLVGILLTGYPPDFEPMELTLTLYVLDLLQVIHAKIIDALLHALST